MPATTPALPASWVEKIWCVMRATYGAEFDRQWEVPAGVDPVAHVDQLKAFWAHELGRYLARPDALAYGLDNLPPRAPNLAEFKALCNRRPDAPWQALAGPVGRPAPEVLALAAAVGKAAARSPRDWIGRLQQRQAQGERLSPAQRQALQTVAARMAA